MTTAGVMRFTTNFTVGMATSRSVRTAIAWHAVDRDNWFVPLILAVLLVVAWLPMVRRREDACTTTTR